MLLGRGEGYAEVAAKFGCTVGPGARREPCWHAPPAGSLVRARRCRRLSKSKFDNWLVHAARDTRQLGNVHLALDFGSCRNQDGTALYVPRKLAERIGPAHGARVCLVRRARSVRALQRGADRPGDCRRLRP